MILHYLKIALRNLLKYRTQSVVSVLGLAIGLVFFTFGFHWLKYVVLSGITILMVLLTVFRQVMRAANENPADVVKSE